MGDAERWVKQALDRGERLMGFGHRVYRAEDPRARVLRRTAREIGAPRLEVAEALEEAALAELQARKPDRVLATNVEFWSAVVLDFADVPPDLFTPLFACARVGGWSAHILEQKREGRLIRPTRAYVGPGAAQSRLGEADCGGRRRTDAGGHRVGASPRSPSRCSWGRSTRTSSSRSRSRTRPSRSRIRALAPPRCASAPRYDPRKTEEDRWIGDDKIAELGERGLLGLYVPEEYGGQGLSQTGYCRVSEVFAQIDATLVGDHGRAPVDRDEGHRRCSAPTSRRRASCPTSRAGASSPASRSPSPTPAPTCTAWRRAPSARRTAPGGSTARSTTSATARRPACS